jgi:hypothetical protein
MQALHGTRLRPIEWFRQLVHPRITTITRARFEAGFTGDAVETAFKEINSQVKQTVRSSIGRQLDGHGLMTTAFSPAIIAFNTLATESDKNVSAGLHGDLRRSNDWNSQPKGSR